jgi:uncharacterized protein YbjT (DUF2867 family)
MTPPARPVALIAGASGLVGRQLLRLLLDDPGWAQVHALVRRPLGIAHPHLVEHVQDFDDLDRARLPAADAAFCCLGTTIKVAGSQPAFRKVDHDYVLAFARLAQRVGARHLAVVSAMGANARSPVFYNRVKGETEQDLRALGLPSLTLVRPSLLAGARAEQRPGERLALTALGPIGRLIPARYRPVADVAVARAMIDAAHRRPKGVEVLESDRLQAFA